MDRNYHILEFDRILELLAQNANTVEAREQIGGLKPYQEERELRRSLRETTQAREMLDLLGTPPLPRMERTREYVDKAVRGELLLPEELEELGAFLSAVGRLYGYLERGKEHQLSIAYYNENLAVMDELREELLRSIRGGRVDDFASPYLKDIRRELTRLEGRMQEKAENVLRTQKSAMADSYVVRRGGRICLPVKREYKARVPGSVIDKSSTGATLFIEPQAVARLGEEWEVKKLEEDCEERRILYTLAGLVAEQESGLRGNLDIIVRLDFMFAKGKLSAQMDAVCPEINTEGRLRLSQARHPFLRREDCVPLDMELGQTCGGVKKRGIVITGPNTGGKTVAIKTAGLFCLMAGAGLHVPCRGAELSMFNGVLCDIGDGQNIEDNLSTFSAHISNVMKILQRITEESLVILDELGSGTDPAEGMGIAVAILERLRESGCLFLVTTHYPEVKTYALQKPEILSARMAFDRLDLKPLYRLEMGKTGNSCALYIAKRLGMPADMLALAAKEAYGEIGAELRRELELDGDTGENVNGRDASLRFREKPSPEALPRIRKIEAHAVAREGAGGFVRGDSVTVLPEGSIGIVAEPADRQGFVLVQIKKEKLRVNYKRLKLKVAAKELYPEDYDFSIVFDTVEDRKARHRMSKKHQEGLEIVSPSAIR